MAILSKSRIASQVTQNSEDFEACLEKGERSILISPFDMDSLGPASYDLHLGPQYISLMGKPQIREVRESVIIGPRESFTVVSDEYIGLPYDVAGIVFSRVSWLEQGLSQISSYVHPGFKGHLAETLTNTIDTALQVNARTAFCQIAFFEVPGGTAGERYEGERSGQTVASIMKRLTETHQNPQRVCASAITEERKTLRGFVRYLFGERRIEIRRM